MEHPTFYRTIQIDGLSIFYREAGPKDAPTLLLLHGFPSPSRMFEPLFARLSNRYHLVAPDYLGFGHSDWPEPKKFAYTFDHYAEIINLFTEALGFSRYTLYVQDYGGPDFRMALAHPLRTNLLSLPTTRTRQTWNAVTRISGPMNLPFSPSPAKPRFKATFSTITAQTSTPIPSGRLGCAGNDHACWLSGASMIFRSTIRSLTPIAGTCRTLKFTFSTPVILLWAQRQMRSRSCCEALSVLHVKSFPARHVGRGRCENAVTTR